MSFLIPATSAKLSGLLSICLLSLILAPVMAAESLTVNSGKYQTAVIELYTSEGCSSCPPADRWFNQLTGIPQQELDVLALAFHVDYWDYIGWKDRFANPSYTNRQRHLARNNNQSSIYTPEFFVNEIEARGTASVLDKIRATNKRLAPIDLKMTLQQDKNNIQINLSSQFDAIHEPEVRYVVYENHLSSDVKKGENAGTTLQHQRVVRYLSSKKTLQAESTFSIPVKAEWNSANLGIGAMVKTKTGNFLQSVSSPLSAK